MKTRLSESQAEEDEPNQSQGVRTCIVIGPSSSASDSDNLVFTPDHKRRSRKRSQKKMETFWLVLPTPIRRPSYDSAYDSDFWFSLSYKRSCDSACDSPYDSDSDSVAKLAFKPGANGRNNFGQQLTTPNIVESCCDLLHAAWPVSNFAKQPPTTHNNMHATGCANGHDM